MLTCALQRELIEVPGQLPDCRRDVDDRLGRIKTLEQQTMLKGGQWVDVLHLARAACRDYNGIQLRGRDGQLAHDHSIVSNGKSAVLTAPSFDRDCAISSRRCAMNPPARVAIVDPLNCALL